MQLRVLTMDQWIFAGKTCLVAAVLLVIVLVFKASYRPGLASISLSGSQPVASKATSAEREPIIDVKPPRLPLDSVMQIEVVTGGQPQPLRGNAFCVRTGPGKSYLVTHASLMTEAAWEQVTQVTLLPTRLLLKQKPLFVGPFTEDHPPNMLAKPDLGHDAVYWLLEETHQVEGLSLGGERTVKPGDTAWIAGPGQNQLKRCSVLESCDTFLSVQPRERIHLEELIGLAVVNADGHVIGTVLGGNDLVVTGASATGLRRVMEQNRRGTSRPGGL